MEAGAKFTLPAASAASNRVLYFYEGDQLLVSGQDIPNYHMVEVISDAKIELVATTETSILVLQGKPINEPVVQYGPFVMNTKEQIQENLLRIPAKHNLVVGLGLQVNQTMAIKDVSRNMPMVQLINLKHNNAIFFAAEVTLKLILRQID